MRLFFCSLLSVLCWAQAERCAIEGQILNSATGEPVKKAQVMLRGMGSSSDPPYGALTDPAGRFSITDVKAGRYVLTAERAGFVRAEYTPGPGRRGATLSLAAGQRINDVVFRLSPHGVIAGRVLDEDGDTVAGVQIQAMRYAYVQGKRTLVAAGIGITNDLGEYRIPGLAAGKYFISASYQPLPAFSRTNAEDNYTPTYYPGTADPTAAAPVAVVPGNQVRGVDINLTRTRTVRVTGKVSNPGAGSGGSRNVMVFLMPRDGGVRGYNSRNSTVVQEGRFEIRGVIPGSYLLAGHWYEDGQRFTASQPVEVGNAGLEGVNLVMTPGFEVPGQVRVEGTEEARFSATEVVLLPANEMAFGGSLGGRVQPDGSFKLTNIAPDHYRVQVFGMPQGCYLKSARLGDNDMLENGGTLTAGSGPLEIVLSAAGGRIEGMVTDANQQPVPGAAVVLVPDARRRHRPDLFHNVTSDQNGRFSVEGIAPGDYRLYAWQEVESGAWQDAEFLKPYEKGSESVTVEERTRQAVQLKVAAGEEK